MGDGQPTAINPQIARAVTLVRALPLRWSDGDSGATEEEVLDRGWFLGGDECGRILADLAALAIRDGGGFGRRWPMLLGDEWLTAPALPVAPRATAAAVGADAEYRRDGRP